jgi:hypothetical protein
LWILKCSDAAKLIEVRRPNGRAHDPCDPIQPNISSTVAAKFPFHAAEGLPIYRDQIALYAQNQRHQTHQERRHWRKHMAYSMLILGASYGSLLGTKLALAGHNVTLVCLPEEVERFNADGARIRLKPKGHTDFIELNSQAGPGTLDACGPDDADVDAYDMIGFAMQEPQYRAESVRNLLARIAAAKKPAMSIMNMPPLPFLARVAPDAVSELRGAFTDPTVWDGFEPGLVTLASPDPQAMRPPEEPINLLQVNLPTNFKVAAFENPRHTAILRQMQADIEAYRHGPDQIELPVKLKVFDSLFVPLAKWAMLVTGNYRCITDGDPISIRQAVHGDVELSGRIYQAVCDLCVKLGASPADMVPFQKYANAAESLIRPSSAARALAGGAPNIERLDKVVVALASAKGMEIPTLADTASQVDAKLEANRG